MGSSIWAVVETKYREEQATSLRVSRQGFSTYYPRFRTRRTAQGVRAVQPLFDRIFFVKIQRDKSLDPIVSTRGVARLLMVGDCLGKVRDADIQDIRSRENALGYVVVQGEEPPGFDLRQSVAWLSDGMKVPGIYLGGTSASRAKVLFAMMGREMAIEVQKRDLVSA
jgi:transcriptional antiterminator RfaH